MCCICCGSILSLVQILLSFVSNSLSYITIPKTKTKKIELRIKLNHNIHKTTLKGKKGGKATQANPTDDWAPKELLAELKRKFPSCHEHPHHLRLSTEAFAPVNDVLLCVICIDITFSLSWMISSTSSFVKPYRDCDHGH